MQTKAFYASKTFWFNILMTVVMAIPVILAAYKAMRPEEAVFADSIAGLITGLGNVVLRVWFTDSGIASTGAQEAKARKADEDLARAALFGR